MQIRKIITDLSILILSFSLAGCYSGSNKKVTVTFWHAMGNPKDKVLETLISDFEKTHSEIKINAQYMGNYDDLYLKLLAGVSSGDTPNISQVYENWTTRLKEANAIVPIERFIKEDGSFTKEDMLDIYPVFVKNNSYNNTMWTFPFNKSIYVFYYNVSAFRKENVQPPKTMNDFLAVCRKLTKKDKTGKIVQYGFGFKANVDIFAILFYLNKGKFFTDNEDNAIFNNHTGYETLRFIVDLVKKHKVAYYSKDYLDNDFASCRIVSFFATTPRRSEMKELLSFKLGVAPLPAWKIQTAPIAGTNLAIFAKKGNGAKIKQRACWEFIKWLSSTENTVKWAIGTSYLPVRRSALKNEMMKKHLSGEPLDLVGIKQLDNATTDPRVKMWQEVRKYVGEAVEKALLGKSTPEQALDEAAKKVNETLRN